MLANGMALDAESGGAALRLPLLLNLLGFSMRRIISLICFLLPLAAIAAPSPVAPQLRPDAPDHHVVVKGDTLWGIAGRFFQDPWRWPYLWGVNKDSIRNPHWIYPGDRIVLDRRNGVLTLAPVVEVTKEIVHLSPRIRETTGEHKAIPSIPADAIEPFLSHPLVTENATDLPQPTVLGAREGRVIFGEHDTIFVAGLPQNPGRQWLLYRPGKTLTDPQSGESLGMESIYLGTAELQSGGEVSSLLVTHSVQEIYQGDRLIAPASTPIGAYIPRAPDTPIKGQIISVLGGVSQAGQNSVVVLSKGRRDGIAPGHVLALYRKGESLRNAGKAYVLPDERYGLIFVFRVFERVAYALVMETRLPVQLLDFAETP